MKEIKAIKTFYKISRATLHLISGISVDALKRYENGETMPHKYNLLLMSMCNIEVFERLFHLTKQLLYAKDIKKIEDKIQSEIIIRERQSREFRYNLMNIV